MRLFGYTLLAFRSLRAHMLRSVLAVFGITIGIAAVLIVVAVAEGARAEISRQIGSLGSNLLLVQPGAQVAQGVRQQAGTMLSLTTADALAMAREGDAGGDAARAALALATFGERLEFL